MRIPLPLLVISMTLLLPSLGSAADANSPVVVTLPSDLDGEISVPFGRPVAELEQAYVEEEFFVSGQANLYSYTSDPPLRGEITVIDPNLPYTTRMLVRRPADPNAFNGTVVIEWLNSTAGFDTAPVWHASAEYFARKGIVYVGVTNSTTTIKFLADGCLLLGLIPPPLCGTRYASLSLSENGVAFEMVSQIAHLLKSGPPESPLAPDYPVQRLFHAGQSQQGGSMVTYASAFHFSSNDGYFVQAASSARAINFGTPCGDPNTPAFDPNGPPLDQCTPTLQGEARRVDPNLPVPVYRVHAETDLSNGVTTRQTESATFRYYETAGTGHITVHKGPPSVEAGVLGLEDPIFLEELCEFPINTLADGPIFGSYLYNAMWDNMEQQVVSGTPPPSGVPYLFALDPNDQILRDSFGNAVGGLRVPQLDFPIATYGPRNALDPNAPDTGLVGAIFQGLGNLFCVLAATAIPFDQATLDSLYPDWTLFVDGFNARIDDPNTGLIAARFLLEEDAAKLRLVIEDKDQQKCIVGLNKNFAKVAKAQGKENCACIKGGSKGKLGGQSIEDCTTADAKNKVAKAKAKTLSKAASDCATAPDFGPNDPNTVNDVAMQKELDLIHDIFGSDLDAAIEDFTTNKPGAKCQIDAAKAAKKCQDAKLKEFNSCKKAGLKDASVHDALTLSDCMGQDPKGKIAKACQTKLKDKLDKKCAGTLDVFPGCNDPNAPATTQELADCLDRLVECRVCLSLNAADNLDRNCDQFDDGLFNGSCP